MRKRTMTGTFTIAQRAILLAMAVAAAPALLGQGKLISGQPTHYFRTASATCTGSGIPLPTCYLVCGLYNIDVPQGATRLDVSVTVDAGSHSVDGYIRLGSDISQSGSGAPVSARYLGYASSDKGFQASILAGDASSGALVLQPGTWTIGLYMPFSIGGSFTGSGTILATTTTSVGPTISSISPTSKAANGPGFTLTVNGAGFVSGSTVEWGASALTTTYVSPTQLTASVSQYMIGTEGNWNISVNNPGGTVSNSVPFTVTPASVSPVISSISPTSQAANGPGFTLTVNGTGFVSGSTLWWGASPLTTNYVSPTQLTSSVSQYMIGTEGSWSIWVSNPGGAVSNSVPFTVTPAGWPSINKGGVVNAGSFAPLEPIAPGTIFSVFGSGFLGGASGEFRSTQIPLSFALDGTEVFVNGVALPLFYLNNGQINAQMRWDVVPETTVQLKVRRNGLESQEEAVKIANSSPGVLRYDAFGYSRMAIITDVNYRLITPTNPLRPGQTFVLWLTGLGYPRGAAPALGDAPSEALWASTPVRLQLGGRDVTIDYAGFTPSCVGLYQVNGTVPPDVPTSNLVVGGVVQSDEVSDQFITFVSP